MSYKCIFLLGVFSIVYSTRNPLLNIVNNATKAYKLYSSFMSDSSFMSEQIVFGPMHTLLLYYRADHVGYNSLLVQI